MTDFKQNQVVWTILNEESDQVSYWPALIREKLFMPDSVCYEVSFIDGDAIENDIAIFQEEFLIELEKHSINEAIDPDNLVKAYLFAVKWNTNVLGQKGNLDNKSKKWTFRVLNNFLQKILKQKRMSSSQIAEAISQIHQFSVQKDEVMLYIGECCCSNISYLLSERRLQGNLMKELKQLKERMRIAIREVIIVQGRRIDSQ